MRYFQKCIQPDIFKSVDICKLLSGINKQRVLERKLKVSKAIDKLAC